MILFKKIFYFAAEKFLESIEVNQNYPALLLHLVEKQDIDLTIRIAGAVAFKNYIKRNWKVVSNIVCIVSILDMLDIDIGPKKLIKILKHKY